MIYYEKYCHVVLVSWKKFLILFPSFPFGCVYYYHISTVKMLLNVRLECIMISCVRMYFFEIRTSKKLVWHAAADRTEVTQIRKKRRNTARWSMCKVHRSFIAFSTFFVKSLKHYWSQITIFFVHANYFILSLCQLLWKMLVQPPFKKNLYSKRWKQIV